MTVLVVALRVLTFAGLNPYIKQNFAYKSVKWIYLSIVTFNILPQLHFIIVNRSNVLLLTEALPVFLENAMVILKLTIFIVNLQILHDLIQTFVFYGDQRKALIMNENQVEAEKISIIIYKIYGSLILCSIIVLAVPPACYQFYKFLAGTATEETYKEPFTNVYFFDNSRSGVYQIVYLTFSLATGCVSYGLVSLDAFYCAASLQLLAILKDVQDYIEDINNTFELYPDHVRLHFRGIVIYHTKILRFVDKFQNCFGSIIFLQYVCSTIIICTCIFQSMLVDYTGVPFIKMMNFSLAGVSQLLMYCWFGTLITDEYYKISEKMYNASWYEFPADIQKSIVFTLAQSQKPLVIKGLHMINCNLEGFMSVLNTSMSALAVLQSIKV